ncbi:MAG TPA: DUF4272 domain-containing protein [Thermoanaerobaculia bacterium]|nr:DUF4272 domain-containing protein [Thermoanaerobaculia bacterium]
MSAEVRARVLKRLDKAGVPTNRLLPLIDEPSSLRPGGDVAVRIIALYALTGLANGADASALRGWLRDTDVYHALLLEERSHFERPLSERDLTKASWRQESLYVLGWAAKLVDILDLPTQECDLTPLFSKIPPEVDTGEFIRELELRPAEEILYQVDLHYCLHWAMRHPAKVFRSRTARQLKVDVIIERRQALEWLISREEWNEIVLDT